MVLRSIIIYGICVSLYAVVFWMKVAPGKNSGYLLLPDFHDGLCLIPASLSPPHPIKSPYSFSGRYSECGADGE